MFCFVPHVQPVYIYQDVDMARSHREEKAASVTDEFLVPSPYSDLPRASIHELCLRRIAANLQYCHIRMRQGVKRYWCPPAPQLMFHLPDRSCGRLFLQNVDGSSRASHIDTVVARKSERTKTACLPDAGVGVEEGRRAPLRTDPGSFSTCPV